MNKPSVFCKFEKIEKYQPQNEKTTITISDDPPPDLQKTITHTKIYDNTLIHFNNITAMIFQMRCGIIKRCTPIEYIIKDQFPIKLFFFSTTKEIGIKLTNLVKKQLRKCLNNSETICSPISTETIMGNFFVFPDYYFSCIKNVQSFLEASCLDSDLKDEFSCALKHAPPFGMTQLTGTHFYKWFDNTKIEDFHLHFLKSNCTNKDEIRVFCF